MANSWVGRAPSYFWHSGMHLLISFVANLLRLAPTLCPLLLQACSDSYYKSIAQALRAIAAYVYALRPSLKTPGDQLAEMLPAFDILRAKLMATDIDQEVLGLSKPATHAV
eukprot:3128156-Amphidinium_carterae.1